MLHSISRYWPLGIVALLTLGPAAVVVPLGVFLFAFCFLLPFWALWIVLKWMFSLRLPRPGLTRIQQTPPPPPPEDPVLAAVARLRRQQDMIDLLVNDDEERTIAKDQLAVQTLKKIEDME